MAISKKVVKISQELWYNEKQRHPPRTVYIKQYTKTFDEKQHTPAKNSRKAGENRKMERLRTWEWLLISLTFAFLTFLAGYFLGQKMIYCFYPFRTRWTRCFYILFNKEG